MPWLNHNQIFITSLHPSKVLYDLLSSDEDESPDNSEDSPEYITHSNAELQLQDIYYSEGLEQSVSEI